MARKINTAVENAGRDQVWITSPARLTSLKPEAGIEARVGTSVYSNLVAVLAREAKKTPPGVCHQGIPDEGGPANQRDPLVTKWKGGVAMEAP